MFATLVMRALGPRSRSELFVHTLRVMGPFGVLVAKRELAPRRPARFRGPARRRPAEKGKRDPPRGGQHVHQTSPLGPGPPDLERRSRFQTGASHTGPTCKTENSLRRHVTSRARRWLRLVSQCDTAVSNRGQTGGACLHTHRPCPAKRRVAMPGHALLPRPPRRRASRFSSPPTTPLGFRSDHLVRPSQPFDPYTRRPVKETSRVTM